MMDQYKAFFLSNDLFGVAPYAQAVIDDDIEAFVQAFEPYKDIDVMIDPIEICVAFNSSKIYNYLLHTYDYSEFYNPFRFTLPMVLIMFERESMLIDTLDQVPFGAYQLLIMYEFMIQTKENTYFKQFYEVYKIPSKHKIDLLAVALNHGVIFDYLISKKSYKTLLVDKVMIEEIVNYHQRYLPHINHVEDLSKNFTIETFIPVLSIDDESAFKKAIDYIVERNISLNDYNAYGLTFFHEALRHAKRPSYLSYLFEKGANPFFKTSEGYSSAHQLLFRDADFTLDLARFIDFDAKDNYGLTLKDYDELQRQEALQLTDVMPVVKLLFNLDEAAIYELDNADFYDLAAIHGIESFLNAYSVIIFESSNLKEQFLYEHRNDIALNDVGPLEDTLGDKFIYDDQTTLELTDDLITLTEENYEALIAFTKKHNTSLKITTDGADINHVGQVEMTFSTTGEIHREATIETNYIDVYYIHHYYGIELEDINYIPPLSKKQRFLS